MLKDSIVVYDITDKIADLVAVIDFGTSPDSFFYDSILKTYNPQSITLTLKVYLNGVLQTSNLTYVWKKNGAQISTTNTVSISLPSDTATISVSLEVTYTYTDSLAVLKLYDSATINVVNIDSTPTVIINPATAIFKTADTSPITVTLQVMYKEQDITGSTSVTSKQWYKGTTAISGLTSSSYNIPRVDVGNTFRFDATINSVTYSLSVQLVEAKEGVSPVFVLISGPTDFVYVDGTANVSSLTLTCSALNLLSPTYQWQYYSGSLWTNISGLTSATLSIPNTLTYIGTLTNVRCQVTSSGNTFTSNELTIKRIYNYTKQLVITPVNGTFFNLNLTSLTFKLNLVDLTNQFTTTDITSTLTWELTTGSNTTTVTPSGGVVTINRNNVSNSLILEATYGLYKNQIVINDLADSATMEIVLANGNHVHFYSNGTSDPLGGLLTFNAKIYLLTGLLINPQPSQLSWSTIPDQLSIGGSLIPGSSPVPKLTLVNNPDGSLTVTIDPLYNDLLSIQCTYSNGQTNISSTMPIIVTRDLGGLTLLVIDQPNGTIYTTLDLNETKTFNLSFYNNGVKQPAIVDEANNYYIRWYMGQTLIASNVDTISILYGQISGATLNLHLVYSFNGTIYDLYLSISKIQLSGNTSLQITLSNGLELTNESQTTNLTLTLYVNGELILSNVSYSWSNGKSDRIISVKTSDVFVMQTYTCTVTYLSQTYTASLTVIDKTDSYLLKIFESSGSTEKYQFQVSILQSSAVLSTTLSVMPKLYLGSSLVNTGNISINVIGKNGNSTYSILASGALIQIPLSNLVTQLEVTTISTTVTANIVLTYTPSGGSTSVVLTQIISVVISNQMYSWLANWNGNTLIDTNSIATGKLFVGTPDGSGVTGVYIGNGLDTVRGKSYEPGIVLVKNNQEKFYVKYLGNNIKFHVGDDDSYIRFDTSSETVILKARVEIEAVGKSNVLTVDDQQMLLPDGLSAYFTISPIDLLNGMLPDGIDPLIIEANGFGNSNSTYNLLKLIGHPNDRTIIDGGKIFANSITAFQIDTEKLFSRYFKIKDGGLLLSDGKTGYNNSTVGVYIDKSGIEIYKNADTYFRFDINNGINLQLAGVTFGSSGLLMTQGSISLSSGKIQLNNNGSGSVLSGGISWDTESNISITGTTTLGKDLILNNPGKIYTNGKSTFASTYLGIFIGYDVDKYKLYIGNDTQYFKYDGINVTMNGTLSIDTNIKIGRNAGGENQHGIKLDSNNYWYSTGSFKVGNGTQSLTFLSGSLAVTGTINATGGSFSGYLTAGTMQIGANLNSTSYNGIYIDGNNHWYSTGDFKVGNSTQSLTFLSGSLAVTGTINATGGSITGLLSVNSTLNIDGTNMKFGKGLASGYNGLYINDYNYWYSTGNFKAGGSAGYISWDNTSLTVKGTIHATDGTITGLLSIGTNMKLGVGVASGKNGIYINDTNYWYDNGEFKIGSAEKYIKWDTLNSTVEVKGTIIATGGSFNENLAVNGTLTIGSSMKIGANVNLTNNGIYIGPSNYWYSDGTLMIGNKESYAYLKYDKTDSANHKVYLIGELSGHFTGDLKFYSVNFSNPYGSTDDPSEIIYALDVRQIYRYQDTGFELLKTYGTKQNYIVLLQNSLLQPSGTFYPKLPKENDPAYLITYDGAMLTGNSSFPASAGEMYYKIDIELYKKYPLYYLRSLDGSTTAETVALAQTITFDFSPYILYKSTAVTDPNTISITHDLTGKKFTVSTLTLELDLNNNRITKTFTKSYQYKIEYYKVRLYKLCKNTGSNSVDNGMLYTFTTRDMGHLLALITIDTDATQDTLTQFTDASIPTKVYGKVSLRTFDGVATLLYYADLLEKLWSDTTYERGTPVQIINGLITKLKNPWKKSWIVSSNPGYLLGSKRELLIPIALNGTVEVYQLFNLDDELCLDMHGKLKRANLLDKLLHKKIIGKVLKIESDHCLILLY